MSARRCVKEVRGVDGVLSRLPVKIEPRVVTAGLFEAVVWFSNALKSQGVFCVILYFEFLLLD